MTEFDAMLGEMVREFNFAVDMQVRAAVEGWSGRPAEEAMSPDLGLNMFELTTTDVGCGKLTACTMPESTPVEILAWETEITEESVTTTFSGPFVKD